MCRNPRLAKSRENLGLGIFGIVFDKQSRCGSLCVFFFVPDKNVTEVYRAYRWRFSKWFIPKQRTQNQDHVNFKCVTYTQPIPLPLKISSKNKRKSGPWNLCIEENSPFHIYKTRLLLNEWISYQNAIIAT